MMQAIAYVLYTNGENQYKRIQNDRFYIVIAKYNPETTISFLNQRFHTVYCDAAFTQSEWGRMIIKECIKPCAIEEFYLI